MPYWNGLRHSTKTKNNKKKIQNLNPRPTLWQACHISSSYDMHASSSSYDMHASSSSYAIPSGRHCWREGRWRLVNPWPYRTVQNVMLISSSSMGSCRRKFFFFFSFSRKKDQEMISWSTMGSCRRMLSFFLFLFFFHFSTLRKVEKCKKRISWSSMSWWHLRLSPPFPPPIFWPAICFYTPMWCDAAVGCLCFSFFFSPLFLSLPVLCERCRSVLDGRSCRLVLFCFLFLFSGVSVCPWL